MMKDRVPMDGRPTSFWEEHRRHILAAIAAVLLIAAAAGLVISYSPGSRAVDHITAVYTGSTKAGTVLDAQNEGFHVTAHYKDGHEEVVTGWTIAEPQTLQDAEKSAVTIVYRKASTQCEVQCTTGLILSITAEYDGDTAAGTEITDAAPGLHVYGIREGGAKEELKEGWRVVNPSILKKDTLSRFEISYGALSCSLSIQCTTKAISRLTAVYSGSTEEGTALSSGCKDIAVTAEYADGTSEQVSGWTLAESVTLEPKTRYLLEVHYEDSMCTLEVFCTTPTPEEFQGGCIPAAHFSLYHNPDHYVGANIAVEGTVVERRLQEDGSVRVFLEMNGDFLGFTKGLLCAVYSNALHGDLPENGTPVTIYGMYKGVDEETYEGETRSLPFMEAEYVVAN